MINLKFKMYDRLTKVFSAIAVYLSCLLIISCLQKNKSDVGLSYEEMLLGTWINNSDEFGKINVTEIFNSDGTWQRGGDSLSIISTGTWTLEGRDTIRIHETDIKVGSTYSPSDNARLYLIINFDDNHLTYTDGKNTIYLQRWKAE